MGTGDIDVALDVAQASLRDRLREAIANVQYEVDRLTTLEEGQARVRQQLWHARTKLMDAEGHLQRATRDERQRLAYQYLNDEAAANPVAAATANVEAAQADIARLEDIESALSGEMGRVQYELRALRSIQYTVMAEYIIESPEYRLLLAQHADAWRRLRTVKAALSAVNAGLHGYLPQRFMDEAQRAEPLEIRVGYPVETVFVEAWVDAMAALEHDADVELPMFG